MDEVAHMRRKKQVAMIADMFEANYLYHEGLLQERDFQNAKENAEHVLIETAFMSHGERELLKSEAYRMARKRIKNKLGMRE